MLKLLKTVLTILCCLATAAVLYSAEIRETDNAAGSLPEELCLGVPAAPDLLLSRSGFSCGYSKKFRQAVWVSYILTAEQLQQKQVKRYNKFRTDPAIRFKPVRPKDYSRTGYDRGHLAPAADMTWSVESSKNSFFMTNISPQTPGCNRGVWKRLETQVRLWALTEKRLCVITGPVFTRNKRTTAKINRIPVPSAFYKVILDLTPPLKMIAFIVPNESSKKRLSSFVVTVKEIENLTGCDFFSNLEDELENSLESRSDFSHWMAPQARDIRQFF